ncbi:MAG: GNAT family N-acetyltransferase [Bulleidia sp.]
MNPDIDITDTILRTERLILRPWKEDDLEDFYTYAKVDGVGQMAGWLPHENIEASKIILDKFITGKKTFALEYEGKVIGSIGIEKYNETLLPELKEYRARELGFVLSKDYWGQGLMPEAVKEVIRYCFEQQNLDVLTCGHFLGNTQSARVQEKCGFHRLKEYTYTTCYGEERPSRKNILWKTEWTQMP